MSNIIYNAPPTVSRFIKDESKLAFIKGPVGCLPAETEFLTPTGWKAISEYAPDDMVAQWVDSGAVEFVYPEQYVVLPQLEPFHRFRNAHSMDMVVSDEHRVVFYNWQGNLTVKPARHIANKLQTRTEGPRFYVPVTFRLPDRAGLPLTDAQIRVMVAVHADGHLPRHYREQGIPRCVICIRKERKKDRLRKLLTDAGIPWSERCYDTRPTEINFTFDAPLMSKTYTSDWYGVSQRQAEIIYEEFPHWDGLIHDDGEIRFTSQHRSDADFIQFICHATGHRATVNKVDYEPENWKSVYVVHATRRLDECSTFRNCEYSQVEAVDGLKYCFVVPSSFFVARHNGKVFITGNSGKSVGCCMKIAYFAGRQAKGTDGLRRTRWIVVRNTREQLKDTTIKTWMDWFPPGVAGKWKETERTFFLEFGDVRAEVMFRALDDPDDVKKVLSLEATGFFINECREIPREIIENASKRTGRYPAAKDRPGDIPPDQWPTWHGLFGDTNAPEEDSYWYNVFEHLPVDEDDPHSILQCNTYSQPGGDSPDAENIENLPKGYYDREGRSEEWYRTMVQVQYARSLKGKPVYEKTFRPEVHISHTPLPILMSSPVIVGQDGARNPASVFMQMLPDGRIHITREAVGFDMGAQTFIRSKIQPVVRTNFHSVPCIFAGDPSWTRQNETDDNSWYKELKKQFPRDDGHAVKSAETNDPIRRINALDEALRSYPDGKPLITIDPSCTWLIQGLRSRYRFARLKGTDNKFHDRPEKNNWSHVVEACQYGVLFLTGRQYNAADYIRATANPFKDSPVQFRPADRYAGY